jgi:hypothetical protein
VFQEDYLRNAQVEGARRMELRCTSRMHILTVERGCAKGQMIENPTTHQIPVIPSVPLRTQEITRPRPRPSGTSRLRPLLVPQNLRSADNRSIV